MKELNDIIRIATNPRRGRAVIYAGVAYIGGIAADDRTRDISGQTRETLSKIDGVLAEVGIDRSRLLAAQIWLKDITRDFAGMNKEWDAWIPADAAPARATAQCELAAPDALVEIIITAAMDQRTSDPG